MQVQHCLDDREDKMQIDDIFVHGHQSYCLVGLSKLSEFAALEASSTYPEKKFDSFFVFENAETLMPLNDEFLFFFTTAD